MLQAEKQCRRTGILNILPKRPLFLLQVQWEKYNFEHYQKSIAFNVIIRKTIFTNHGYNFFIVCPIKN